MLCFCLSHVQSTHVPCLFHVCHRQSAEATPRDTSASASAVFHMGGRLRSPCSLTLTLSLKKLTCSMHTMLEIAQMTVATTDIQLAATNHCGAHDPEPHEIICSRHTELAAAQMTVTPRGTTQNALKHGKLCSVFFNSFWCVERCAVESCAVQWLHSNRYRYI